MRWKPSNWTKVSSDTLVSVNKCISRRAVEEETSAEMPGIAHLSDMDYPVAVGMKSITIKLPEAVARELREHARQSGRSVAALIRERLEKPPEGGGSFYALSADLAGSLAGSRMSATNTRRRFRRS
jgi:Ribbon-helix-helix protein, copG family